MVNRDELIKFIHSTIGADLFAAAQILEERANGVQFLGSQKVSKVALGVSLNQDFLKEAVSAGAQFCIFHHGLDTETNHSLIPRFTQSRLQTIIKNNLSIMGLHFVLDAHPSIGNNAIIIKKLGAQLTQPLLEWGFVGKFPKPQDVKQLSKLCSKIFTHDVFAVFSGPKIINQVGVVSGSGSPATPEMLELEAKRVELYITGEPNEPTPHRMKESGINYFACGHYSTEVFGIQELGKVIKSHFKDQIEVEFIDIPNPV